MDKVEHLLVCISEECSEVIKAISKALRFGLNYNHPSKNITNLTNIEMELDDLSGVLVALREEAGIELKSLPQRIIEKKKRVKEYMNHAREIGKIT